MDLSAIAGIALSLLVQILTPPKIGSELLTIPQGTLEGYTRTSRNGRIYKAFSGIPYAVPPLGPLRFKDPLPAGPWQGVLSATRSVRCVDYQALLPPFLRIADGEEDCLVLNVFTHDVNPVVNKPVLLYIHGGSFEFRIGPKLALTPTYFMDHDLVVVTINYRLGALGFMSFEDDVIPGNMGLKDQNMALRWVYENIAHFGGDPNRITLMGESAGSVSCHYHSLMPSSRSMVSKVIMQSGSAYGPWGLDAPGQAKSKAIQLAELFDCKRPTSEEMVDCLQKIPPREIASIADEFRNFWDRDPLILFQPVVERPSPGAFITAYPYEWPALEIPALMGTSDEDGLLKTIYMLQKDYNFAYVSQNLPELLPPSLMFQSPLVTSDPAASADKIIQFYLGGRRRLSLKDEPTFSAMFSDGLFRWPMKMAVERSVNNVYFYINNFTSDNIYLVPNRVFHNQETFFLFEPEIMPNRLRGEDLQFSEQIVSWWANFAIHGNPNEPGTSLWTPSSDETIDYLHIQNSGSCMTTGFYPDAMNFWTYQSGVIDGYRLKTPSLWTQTG